MTYYALVHELSNNFNKTFLTNVQMHVEREREREREQHRGFWTWGIVRRIARGEILFKPGCF